LCARRIGERRRQLGLTQCDVVERLKTQGLAATNRTLSAMEHGQGVDVGRLPELAVALDCTVSYLLGLTTEPTRWAPDDLDIASGESVNAARPGSSRRRASWILGPDVPDRHRPAIAEHRLA
jgi:transcriptional regulator with XRE-family HTH domain